MGVPTQEGTVLGSLAALSGILGPVSEHLGVQLSGRVHTTIL